MKATLFVESYIDIDVDMGEKNFIDLITSKSINGIEIDNICVYKSQTVNGYCYNIKCGDYKKFFMETPEELWFEFKNLFYKESIGVQS